MREVNSLVVCCRWKRLGCDWQGELRQLEDHLCQGVGPSGEGCGYVLVECSYRCGRHFERRHIQDHETEACPKRPVEIQMSSLANRFEDKMVARLDTVVNENRDMKEELCVIHEQNKSLREDIKSLKDENKTIREELQAIKTDSLSTRQSLTINPPYYFTLYNYKHHKTNNLVWFSPPFYSHNNGYKMRVQLYANGTKSAKNKHLSLFVSIMLGEYDSSLQWPFLGAVTVQIYNCSFEKWGHIDTIEFRGTGRCSKRPLDCVANDGTGTTTWISQDELEEHYMYRGYDFIRFRVLKVEHMIVTQSD